MSSMRGSIWIASKNKNLTKGFSIHFEIRGEQWNLSPDNLKILNYNGLSSIDTFFTVLFSLVSFIARNDSLYKTVLLKLIPITHSLTYTQTYA